LEQGYIGLRVRSLFSHIGEDFLHCLDIRLQYPGQFHHLFLRQGPEQIGMDHASMGEGFLFDLLNRLACGDEIAINTCVLASKLQHGLSPFWRKVFGT
jgi:hypothetical protein